MARLEGQIAEESLAELERLSSSLSGSGAPWSVDLHGVVFVDRSGVRLLRRLARQGIALAGSSPFVASQLEEAPGEADHEG